MKHFLLFTLCLITGLLSAAPEFGECNFMEESECQVIISDKATEVEAGYILSYLNYAKMEAERARIPTSITLAQAILESDRGRSNLAQKHNNHFGIKWWKNKFGNATGRVKKPDGYFRTYDDVLQSYMDHSDFLVDNSRYVNTFDMCGANSRCWSFQLQYHKYATDPGYASKLIRLIRRLELWRYDGLESEPENTDYIEFNFVA